MCKDRNGNGPEFVTELCVIVFPWQHSFQSRTNDSNSPNGFQTVLFCKVLLKSYIFTLYCIYNKYLFHSKIKSETRKVLHGLKLIGSG